MKTKKYALRLLASALVWFATKNLFAESSPQSNLPGSVSTPDRAAVANAAPSTFEFSAFGSFTGTADAKIDDVKVGDLRTNLARFSATYKYPVVDRLTLDFGVAFDQISIDTNNSSVPLPERLQSIALVVGGTWQIDRKWALIASVRPGRYSDTEAGSSDSFSVPGVVLARWSMNKELTFFFGARVQSLSNNPVLPVGGARWQIQPDWLLTIGFPRTEATYTFDRNTTFFAGVGFEGGSYAIDDPKIVAPTGRNLRDTQLDYRSVHATLGVQRTVSPGVQLRVEGGYAFARRFDYYDRAVEVKPAGAAYGAIALTASF